MPDSVIIYDERKPPTGHAETSRLLASRLSIGLVARAQHANVQLDAVYQAAWAIVLSCYAGESSVRFGAMRDAAHGHTLLFRLRISAQQSVDALLQAVEAQGKGALEAHAQTPAAQGQPLFESVVTFAASDLDGELRANGVLCVRIEHGAATQLRIQFDRSRFRDDAIERLLASLCFVLEQLSSRAPRSVGEIDVVPAGEREKILRAWNDTAHPLPEALLIHEAFEARANEQPEAIALEFVGLRVSYAELERRANQMANALRERGARPGVFIGVCVERGVALVISLLAVAKSGAAYVPLDPREPKQRLASMLADAGAGLVITQDQHRGLFAADIAVLDVQGPELAAMPTSRPARISQAADTCYAIFTSGSTGRPNGAELSHRAVVNTLDWVNRTFAVGPGDRLLFVTSPCFDLSVYDIFGVLGAGGTVVVASDAQLAEPAEVARLLHHDRITIWNSAPVALQRVIAGLAAPSSAAALRLVLLSGDWIPVQLPTAVRRGFPNAKVVSLGGATEAAIWSNWFPIDDVDPGWTSIPYGKPIQNARYHVLDPQMRPVPVGVTGDLYIGGTCLAEGYLNRPQLNQERFVRDPFQSSGAGERLYKTGDLARYFSDGNLEFLGRSDFQVKIRGFRVETGEVEVALLAMPGIEQAVCTASADASGENSLIAYVVIDREQVHDEKALRQALAGMLPAFMVPARVIRLRELPLSSNGKVDRRALRAACPAEPERAHVAPRNELEQRLVEVWQTVLGRSPIGVTDDFFDAGGHSVLALMAIAQSSAALGFEVSLSRFLERPTIEGVLQSVEANTAGERVSGDLYSYHAGGRRPPIVMLGSGPFALLYREFPKLFGADQPFHLLHAASTDSSAGAAAARCETQIATACPTGPVIVGGFGATAPFALALARRLQARGRWVPLVVVIDPPGAPGARASHSLVERLTQASRRVRERAFGSQRLSSELLVIRGEDGAGEHDDAASEDAFRSLVAGPVSVLRVRGHHMSFLADSDHRRVIDGISSRIERLMRFAGHAQGAPSS